MKKFAAVFLLILTVAMLAGCAGEKVPFTAGSYEAENVTRVKVDVRDRRVRVALSEDDRIHVAYFESEKEFLDFAVTDGCLSIASAADKGWKDYIGTNEDREVRTISLLLPRDSLEELTIATTNEDISLPGLTVADRVSLCANGGNIGFDTLDVGHTLNLEVKNGDISGRILGGYDDFDMTCRTKKGECNLPERKEGGEKVLTVTANNGDVDISFE